MKSFGLLISMAAALGAVLILAIALWTHERVQVVRATGDSWPTGGMTAAEVRELID